MTVKRPVVLCAVLCILSAVCVSYKTEYVLYAVAAISVTAALFFIGKNKRAASLFMIFTICLLYAPFVCTARQLAAKDYAKNYPFGSYTAVVENISQSYDTATLFVKTVPQKTGEAVKKAVLRTDKDNTVPELYDVISFSGSLLPIDKEALAQNKLYGAESYYYSKGCDFIAVSDGFENLGRQSGFSGVYGIKYKFYYYITDKLKDVFPVFDGTDTFVYVRALLTGDRAGLDDYTYSVYRYSGLVPFLCISGLHVVISGAFLLKLLEMLKLNKRICLFINLVFLLFIVIVSGSGASVVRAAVMSAVVLVCNYFGCGGDRLSVVGISFLLIFLCNPYCVFDYGTRLSFLAMLGLVCSSLKPKGYKTEKEKRYLAFKKVLITGFYAMGFTLPTIVSAFGGVYLLSPFSNAAASVIFTPFMYILVAVAFLGFLPEALLKIPSTIAIYLLKMFEYTAKAFCEIPFSYANVVLPQAVYTVAGIVFVVFLLTCAFCSLRKVQIVGTLFCLMLLPSVLFLHFIGCI